MNINGCFTGTGPSFNWTISNIPVGARSNMDIYKVQN